MLDYLIPLIQNEPSWKLLKTKQQKFCLSVLNGHNIFLSGQAGSGKSFVLNFLFGFFERQGVHYGKTATTGIAALNISGSTIHSWAGIGLGNTDANDILKNVFRNKKATARIQSTQVLFIDEVSMCSGGLLDKLEYVIGVVRRNSRKPWGGLQIICCADFFQLPPVNKDLLNDRTDFAFESNAWRIADFKNILLTENVRQQNDKVFTDLLNQLRVGDISNISILNSRVNASLDSKANIRPVKLFGYNSAVEKYNNQCLSAIPSKSYFFTSKDKGGPHHIEFFNKNCQAPQTLELKLGAQVMLLKNVHTERGLVNGSVGIVTSIQENVPVVKFKNGESLLVEPDIWEIKEQVTSVEPNGKESIKYKVTASRTQIPLKLSFACTLHKAQGTTLDAVELDLNQCFETGMGYVALSRVRDMQSLSLRPFDPSKIRVNKKCLDFYKNLVDN